MTVLLLTALGLCLWVMWDQDRMIRRLLDRHKGFVLLERETFDDLLRERTNALSVAEQAVAHAARVDKQIKRLQRSHTLTPV